MSCLKVGCKILRRVAIVVCLLTFAAITRAAEPAPPRTADYLREAYREDAEKCHFSRADGTPLKLAKKPIMRWTNDDDWSGDVFVWSDGETPAVIGCILSGPFDSLRYVYHEFHLLSDKPIAGADVQDGRRWEPATKLERELLADVPPPAGSASGRLVQMRKIARSFTAQMEADGRWELRLLPQPLIRFGKEDGDVLDGALFCYVWTKGTDPELILLLECRRDGREPAWHYAPVLFTNREVWLKHEDREVWHAEPHQEPAGKLATGIYTTAFARSIPAKKEADVPTP
ncbi:MAG TPA: hypothetical protein VHC22_16900 [Pirellulales bacterium]|nr:hypothetical protein [Pirellulales bacterium]